MKFVVTVLLVITLSLAKAEQANTSTSERCTNACPKHLDPVCAVSGDESAATAAGAVGEGVVYRYFHNDCLRRYASCSTGIVWRITSLSLCLKHVDPLVREQCLRPCPFIYEPICASNGKTKEIFGNSCILEVENCLSVDAWTLIDDSDCGL